jgi:ribosomal protein S27E
LKTPFMCRRKGYLLVVHVFNAARRFVRFYAEYIECDFCGEPTRGRVYDQTQEVICGACGKILLIVESKPVYEV